MLELFKKYLSFDDSNAHVAKKLSEAKDLDSAFKVFEDNGWFIGKSIIDAIKEDYKEYEKDAEKAKAKLAKENAKKAEADAEAEAKAKAEEEAAKKEAELAKGAKPSKSLDSEAAKRYEA